LRPRYCRPEPRRAARGAEAGRCVDERDLALPMDSMTSPLSMPPRTALPPATDELFPTAGAPASMPERDPIEMPTQSFSRYDKRRPRVADVGMGWRVRLARLVVFGGAIGLTAYGASEMYAVLAVGGVTTLEWVLLILFVVNFSWI